MTNSMKGKRNKAKKMIKQGVSISQTSKNLGVDSAEVKGIKQSWSGAKWMITHRLNRLIHEEDQAARKQLVDEVKGRLGYLYGAARSLSKEVTGP